MSMKYKRETLRSKIQSFSFNCCTNKKNSNNNNVGGILVVCLRLWLDYRKYIYLRVSDKHEIKVVFNYDE